MLSLFQFVLGDKAVIRAWDNAIGTMKVGELAILDCGADWCYGAAGSPPKIPEDADLVFEIELLSWDPNAKQIIPGVVKMYVARGEGWNTPTAGTICHIKIVGRVGGEDGPLFLDCRDDAILVPIDIPQLPPGLETALCTMKKGERAHFWIESELTGDGFEPLRHKVALPRDAQLFYEIEMEDFENIKEAWEMTPAEKAEEARRLKEVGNDFFRSGQPERALIRYDASVKIFEHETGLSEADQKEADAIKLLSLVNMATVKHKMQKWRDVLEHAGDALAIEPANVKALFRRAQAEAATGLVDEAVATLRAALAAPAVTAAQRAEVDKLMRPLLVRQAKLNAKEKSVWGAAFSSFSTSSDDAARAAAQPKQSAAAKAALEELPALEDDASAEEPLPVLDGAAVAADKKD